MSFTEEEIRNYINVYQTTLFDNCFPFWLKYGWDREKGGIITSLDRDGNIIDTDKGVWQQGRFAWTMGYAYNTLEKRIEWLDALESTLDFITRYCIDRDGRLFFQVTREGLPIRKRRYCFSEVFASLGYGEHYRATGNEESARMARRLFEVYRDHICYPPKFYPTRPMKTLSQPMIYLNLCQRLRNSIGLENANAEIDRTILEIERDFIKDDLRCCLETVGINGEIIDHFDGRLLNPGHSIEGSWFIMFEGELRNKPEYIDLGCRMLDYAWERGWDEEYGGIFYYRDVYNKPVAEYWQDAKHWWPHNETLIAMLLAWYLTRNEKYAERYRKIHNYTYNLFPDRPGLDWFGYFNRDGRIMTDLKGNMYKGCFHVPRQQMVCLDIAKKILKTFEV